MLLHRKCQELPLGCPPEDPWDAGVQKPYDSAKHAVGCSRVALMQPEHAVAGDTQHNGPVVMGYHVGNVAKSKQAQPLTQDRVVLLPRCPPAPLPRCPASVTVRDRRRQRTPPPSAPPAVRTKTCPKAGNAGWPSPSGSAG